MSKRTYMLFAVVAAVVVTCGCGQATVQQSGGADQMSVTVDDGMETTTVDMTGDDMQVETPGASVDMTDGGVHVDTPGVSVDIDQ